MLSSTPPYVMGYAPWIIVNFVNKMVKTYQKASNFLNLLLCYFCETVKGDYMHIYEQENPQYFSIGDQALSGAVTLGVKLCESSGPHAQNFYIL